MSRRGERRIEATLEALLLIHPEVDLARVWRAVEELAQLAEEPAILAGLEAVIARVGLGPGG